MRTRQEGRRRSREGRAGSHRVEKIHEGAVRVGFARLIDDAVVFEAAIIGTEQKRLSDSGGVKVANKIGRHGDVLVVADHVVDADSDAQAARCGRAGDDEAPSRERKQAGTVDIDGVKNGPLLDRPVVVEPVHPAQRSKIGRLLRGRIAAIIDARIGIDEDAVERRQETEVLPEEG